MHASLSSAVLAAIHLLIKYNIIMISCSRYHAQGTPLCYYNVTQWVPN